MNKVFKTLNEPKFQDLLLIWSLPAKNLICIRDKKTGQTKIITVR